MGRPHDGVLHWMKGALNPLRVSMVQPGSNQPRRTHQAWDRLTASSASLLRETFTG